MTALGPSEITARRRPFVVLAIAALRICAGFCLAFPLASLVSSSGVGLRGEGDRALFEGGGYLLLEILRLHASALLATVRGLLPLLLLGLVLTCACNVALLVALDVRERLTSLAWLSRAWARLPAQLVIVAGAALTQILLFMVGSIAVGSIPELLAKPVATTLAQAAVLLLVALLLGAVGGFADVTKASLVRHEARLSEGLARAWLCARHRPFRACFGWLPYAVLFMLVALAASKLTEALDVSRAGAWRVAGVVIAHQLVILVSVALRAAWFARALRLVATAVG
jgi:hypothetical protein